MVAMLRTIVLAGQQTRKFRRTWFIHIARSKAERAFETEIMALAAASDGAVGVTRVLTNIDGAEPNDYEIAGRISAKIFTDVPRLKTFDIFLCGPTGFVQEMYDDLLKLGVADKHIFNEAFGNQGLRRQRRASEVVELAPPETEPVEVEFKKSGAHAVWTPVQGSLLELAESIGLDPPSSCRGGSCGTCRTKVLSGSVTYSALPGTHVSEGEALICCAVPAKGAREKLVLAV